MKESSPGLEAALERVRVMLRRYLLINTPWLAGVGDGASGRALVAFVMGRPGVESESVADIATLDEVLDRDATPLPDPVGVGARLAEVAAAFSLSPRDLDGLWIMLAPEFDFRFLMAYRMVWGAPAQRYCEEDFVHAMLSPHGPYRVQGLFDDGRASLLQLGLLRLETESDGERIYRPSRRLIEHLCGLAFDAASDGVRVALVGARDVARWDGFDLADALRQEFGDTLIASRQSPGAADAGVRPIFIIEANRLASADLAVTQFVSQGDSGANGWPCVVRLDLGEPGDERANGAEHADNHTIDLVRAALREARLARGVLHLRGGERLAELTRGALCEVVRLMRPEHEPVFIECNPQAPARLLAELAHAGLGARMRIATLPAPVAREREVMWHYLYSRIGLEGGTELGDLSAIPCDARTMEAALDVRVTTNRPTLEALRALIASNLPRFARRVEVKLDWAEVVLPEDTLAQLRQVRALATHQERIMNTWGLAKRATGRGVKVLFSGPSGTGKTLTAGLLAKDARCELYQVDVSSIMSKWVGETEKHLAQLFRESQSSGSAILFDEADALFRQRTSGGDGGERFGTQLVNFLLEAIESFDGMIILTTNFDTAIDTAFARRMSFHVRFRAPDAPQRADLWRLHLPASLPLSPTVDIHAIGETYELTGGEIYQAAVRSAVAAVERRARRVELRDIEMAVESLYQEKGRLPPRRLTVLDAALVRSGPPGPKRN